MSKRLNAVPPTTPQAARMTLRRACEIGLMAGVGFKGTRRDVTLAFGKVNTKDYCAAPCRYCLAAKGTDAGRCRERSRTRAHVDNIGFFCIG